MHQPKRVIRNDSRVCTGRYRKYVRTPETVRSTKAVYVRVSVKK